MKVNKEEIFIKLNNSQYKLTNTGRKSGKNLFTSVDDF